MKNADSVTFTEEILNGKLHFFVYCSEAVYYCLGARKLEVIVILQSWKNITEKYENIEQKKYKHRLQLLSCFINVVEVKKVFEDI